MINTLGTSVQVKIPTSAPAKVTAVASAPAKVTAAAHELSPCFSGSPWPLLPTTGCAGNRERGFPDLGGAGSSQHSHHTAHTTAVTRGVVEGVRGSAWSPAVVSAPSTIPPAEPIRTHPMTSLGLSM